MIRKGLQLLSLSALLMTVVPPVLFLTGSVDLEWVKTMMGIAALVWFIVTPFWMGKKKGA